MLWELSLGGGSQTLGAVRALLRTHPLRLAIPESPAELVSRFASGLDVGERIAADAPMHAISVVDGDSSRNVVAVPIRVDPDPSHPLGAAIPVVPGGPEGGFWIGAAPADDAHAAVALVDDVLVFGESAGALRLALPYLAFTLAPREIEPGLSISFREAVGGELRAMLEAALRAGVTEELERARSERERHDAPPDFGEPEAVIRSASRFAETWLAYLPDVGATTLRVAIGDGSITATLDAQVREGSPLAERLDTTPSGDTSSLAALPADSAVALSFRTPVDREPRFSFTEALTQIAGDRLDERGREAALSLGTAWEEARGPETILAAGGGAEDAWLFVALPGARQALPESAMRDVLGTRYLGTLFGAAFDCARPPRPRFGAALCDGAPSLFLGAGAPRGEALLPGMTPVVGLARDVDGMNAFAPRTGASFGSEPDISRALSALGDDQLLTLVVIPSRLLGTGGLSNNEGLRRLAGASALSARSAPVALGISKTDEGLRVTLHGSDSGIEDALGVADAF